jgi:hypothetical protein
MRARLVSCSTVAASLALLASEFGCLEPFSH